MSYCNNCGNQFNECDQFCKHCGAKKQTITLPPTADMPVPPLAPTARKIQPVHIVIGVLGLLLFLLLAVFLIAYHTQMEPESTPEKPTDTPVEVVLTWQEQYDLGTKYLLDGSYEEAIIAFEAAIELEPMNAQLYMDLADAYVAMDDWEMAFSTLEDGYALTEDEDLALYLEQLQEAYIIKNAPDFTDLITELETVLAFQMFAGDVAYADGILYSNGVSSADINLYRYDFSGDGELDWILEYYTGSADMHEALFYSLDGGTAQGTTTQYGWPGTTSHTELHWSETMQQLIKINVHAGASSQSYVYRAYNNQWTELASYERDATSEEITEAYIVNDQAANQGVYEAFVNSLELTPLTSGGTLAQLETVSVDLDPIYLPYLYESLMESEIFAYSEIMDLDGDGVDDYMLHTDDAPSSWRLAEDELQNIFPVWYPKTMVILSSYQNPYAYAASTAEASTLRTQYYDTINLDSMEYTELADGSYNIMLWSDLCTSVSGGEKLVGSIRTTMAYSDEEAAVLERGDTLRLGAWSCVDMEITQNIEFQSFSGYTYAPLGGADYSLHKYETSDEWNISEHNDDLSVRWGSPVTIFIPENCDIYMPMVQSENSISGDTVAEMFDNPDVWSMSYSITVENGVVTEVIFWWHP